MVELVAVVDPAPVVELVETRFRPVVDPAPVVELVETRFRPVVDPAPVVEPVETPARWSSRPRWSSLSRPPPVRPQPSTRSNHAACRTQWCPPPPSCWLNG